MSGDKFLSGDRLDVTTLTAWPKEMTVRSELMMQGRGRGGRCIDCPLERCQDFA